MVGLHFKGMKSQFGAKEKKALSSAPLAEKADNHGDFGVGPADHAMAPQSSSASAAPIEGTVKLPDHSAAKPAKIGPIIWPTPKAAVIRASTRRGASGASNLPA